MSAENVRTFRGRRKDSMYMRAAVLMLSVGCSLLLAGCWGSGSVYGSLFRPDFATISTYPGERETWEKLFPLASTHRFYLESDVVFLPELLGTWNDEENGFGIVIEPRGRRDYRITFTGKDGKTGIKGRLVRLGGELYLQLRWCIGCGSRFPVRTRRIGRIRVEGGALRIVAPRHRPKNYRYFSGFWIGISPSDIVPGGNSKKKLRKYFIKNADKYFSGEKETILRRVSQPEEGNQNAR